MACGDKIIKTNRKKCVANVSRRAGKSVRFPIQVSWLAVRRIYKMIQKVLAVILARVL